MKHRKFGALVLVLLLVVMSVGAYAKAEEKVTISVWLSWNDVKREVILEELEPFKAAHPEIDLQVEILANAGNDALRTKVQTSLSGDALPDVFDYWFGSDLTVLVDAGVLMDASEYLARSTQIKYEDITKGAWDYATQNGVIYGYPAEGFRMGWFCNSQIFKELGLAYPKTMAELCEMAPVMVDAGYIPLAIGSSAGNPGQYLVSDLQYQYEGGAEAIANIDATNQIDTPSLRKVAAQILKLREAGVFPLDTIANGDWSPSFELYNSGRAAMLYTASYTYGGMSEDLWAKTDLINVPLVDDYDIDSSTFAMTSANHGFCVTRKAWEESEAKRDALTALLDFFLGVDLNQKISDRSGGVSTMVNVQATNPVDAAVKDFYYSGDRIMYPAQYNMIRYRPAWEDAKPYIDELFAGNVTVEEFAKASQDVFDNRYK